MSENREVLVDIGRAAMATAASYYNELAEQAELELSALDDGHDAYQMPQTGETADERGFRHPSRASGNMVISEINGYPVKGDLLNPSQDVRSFEPFEINDGNHSLSLYLDNSPYGMEMKGFVDGQEVRTFDGTEPYLRFEYDGMKNFSENTEKDGDRTIHVIDPDTQFAFKMTAEIAPEKYLVMNESRLRGMGFDVDKGLEQVSDLTAIVPKVNGGEEKAKAPNHDDDLFGR